MESLDMLANNIANASTSGYKADREFYTLYSAPEAASYSGDTMPLIERPWIDLSQGSLRVTGNSLDLAISGSGFFSVQGSNGPLYTRNGSFRVSAEGKLADSEGHAVLASDGSSIAIEANQPIVISPDGTVRQGGAAVGQISVVSFANTAGLAKQGSSYFRVVDKSVSAASASQARVEQGKLEDSNTGNAEAAVRLVAVMRHFEMLQKAAGMAGDLSRKAIEEVAKVG
jgi:flagellar basal body rod protein FlgG